MNMKKIMMFVGTRPELIKMAPVIQAIQHESRLKLHLCATGQHTSLLTQMLNDFAITPDTSLVLEDGATELSSLLSDIVKKTAAIIQTERPDLVLVHGDTATTLATTLSAFLSKCKIGHVEAGLRTGDLASPWPEEGNRRLVSVVSDIHFAPTEDAKKNLLMEGIDKSKIVVTGNTVVDALMFAKKKIQNNHQLTEDLSKKYGYLISKRNILVTTHRRENSGSGFKDICLAINQLADILPQINFIFPVHPNPAVKNVVTKIIEPKSNVQVVEPLAYLEFVFLMQQCWLIMTDSGGIQEEAPTFNKPVLVMRDTTERPEAIHAGTAKLVGTQKDDIIREVLELFNSEAVYQNMIATKNPFGDGKASQKICQAMINIL